MTVHEDIRQDHSTYSEDRAKADKRSEIARQIDEYLARGGRIQQIPTGEGDYWELTISEREKRKRRRHASE